jgi:hypothetical protein
MKEEGLSNFNLIVGIVSLIAGILSIFFSLRKLYQEWLDRQNLVQA